MMLKPEFDTLETTYADLRPTDKIVAKDGTVWPIADFEIHPQGEGVTFFLCDPQTKVKLHHMARMGGNPVTVSRIPTHADDVAKAEADFPAEEPFNELGDTLADVPEPRRSELAEELLAEELGATVEAEVTAEETDAVRQATEEQPVELPAFADMTGLEQRSHMYLLHGVVAYDLQSKATLEQTHTQAHADYAAGKLKARQIPHTHGEAKS